MGVDTAVQEGAEVGTSLQLFFFFKQKPWSGLAVSDDYFPLVGGSFVNEVT